MTGSRASDYTPERLDLIKATCLSIAVALGDEACRNEIVIVGGLVPALLYGGKSDDLVGEHIGTNDVDLVLDLVILDKDRYEEVRMQLMRAGFTPDITEAGAVVRQRWHHAETGSKVDFLMPLADDLPEQRGRLQNLTGDFAAIKMLGLDLALQNKIMLELEGRDLQKRLVSRSLPLCSPEVFVVLKAIAMKNRDKPKDAYDLYFVLRHVDGGPVRLGATLSTLGEHVALREAVESLERDFETVDSRGPKDVCSFLGDPENDELAADVLANVRDLLKTLRPK